MLLLDRTFDVSTEPVAGVTLPPQTLRAVEQFLFREASLLDDRRFEDWLALWEENGRYWVPRFHGQANPFEQVSLFWEDAMLRDVRVRRLHHARNWSQQPPVHAVHLVGNISVQGVDAAGHLIVRSALQYTEWRTTQRHLAATVFHKLAADGDSWKLVLKRVNLVNCDDVFGNLEVFI